MQDKTASTRATASSVSHSLADLSDISSDEPILYQKYDASSQSTSIYGGTAISAPPSPEPVTTIPRAIPATPPATATHSANWSTSVQTLLDQPPSALPQRLVIGGIIFCLTFGAWATFGRIDEVGHARGRLVPKGEAYKVDPVEMGKVASISVKEGQSVKAGQVLVELDTQMATGEIDRLQQMLTAYNIELSQKQTLLEKAHLEARTRDQISQASADSQKAAIAQANAKAEATTALLSEHQAAVAALSERITRLTPLTNTAKELLQQREADVVAQKERLNRLAPLLTSGAISKEVVFQAQQNLRDRQSAIIQTHLSETTSTKEQLFQAQQNLRERQSAITQSQGELQQIRAESTRLQAELTQKQAEGRRTRIEAQQQIQQLKVDTTQLKGKIADTQNLLTSAKTKLEQRFLKAPVDGVVSSLNVRNKGEVVQPSQTVAEVAPQNAPLVVSATLPNQEAGFVKTGMPVQVKLDAYPYQDYGVVPGKVTSVSSDAKPDQQAGSVYRVEIALERNYIKTNHQTIQFKAGQTASADITIRQRHIVDILLDPIKQLQKGGLSM